MLSYASKQVSRQRLCIESRERRLSAQLVSLQSMVIQLEVEKSRLSDQNKHYISHMQSLNSHILQKKHLSIIKNKAIQLLLILLLLSRRLLLAQQPSDSVSASARTMEPSEAVSTCLIEESALFSVIIEALRLRKLLRRSEASRLVLVKRNRTLVKNLLYLLSAQRSWLIQLIVSQRSFRFSQARFLIVKRMMRMLTIQHIEEREKLESASEWYMQQLMIQLLQFRKLLLVSYSRRGNSVSKTSLSVCKPATSELEAIKLSVAELQIEKRSLATALASVLKALSFTKPAPAMEQTPIKELIMALAFSLKTLRRQRSFSKMLKEALHRLDQASTRIPDSNEGLAGIFRCADSFNYPSLRVLGNHMDPVCALTWEQKCYLGYLVVLGALQYNTNTPPLYDVAREDEFRTPSPFSSRRSSVNSRPYTPSFVSSSRPSSRLSL